MSFIEKSERNEKVKGYFLSKYAVLIEDGVLKDYVKIEREESIEGYSLWWVFVELQEEDPWFNNQTYVNTLDKEAIEKFIKITHEKYYEVVGDEFNKSIPAIFTDEPQFTHKESLAFSDEKREIKLPYTDDFDKTFVKKYDYNNFRLST